MADLYARYHKTTASGGDFTLELYEDGTLREWATSNPDDLWTGTWEEGGKLATSWWLRTRIGDATNEYEWATRRSTEQPSGIETVLKKLD